ncbi:MAG: ABC transporter substrate-binding protein [Acidobacteria bacterium]|nr:ABC transporter substrate-binding protein [Acidobacteriota bacterium]
MKRCLWIVAVLASTFACSGEREGLVIGSKNFSEQIVLAEIMAQQIERRTDITVERRLNLGGTIVCHRALVAGQIDLYPEYTGTSFVVILREKVISEPRVVYERVKAEYDERFQVAVGQPFGFENTYALLIRGEDAKRLGATTLSDIVPHSASWQAGVGHEFIERADGYSGLVETYGLRFDTPPLAMDLNLVYRAIEEGKVDLIVGNSTDARIVSLDLVQLTDDRGYFPPYEAVPMVRKETLARYPEIAPALAELAGTITTDEMRRMNYQVDVEHQDAAQVAKEFLDGLETTEAAGAGSNC